MYCFRCETKKPLTDFYRDRKAKSGYRSSCKSCQNYMADPAPPGVTSKVCYGCGEDKPLEDFYRNTSGKYRRTPRCKPCAIKHHLAYKKRKGEIYLKYGRKKSKAFRLKYGDRVINYDSYIRKTIMHKTVLKDEDIPQEMIEEKRKYLKLKREYLRKKGDK